MLTEEIRNRVEQELQINLDERRENGKHIRTPEAVYARSLYYGLCREFSNLSLSDIAATLGQNHATVLHSLNNVFSNFEVWNDKVYLNVYTEVSNQIKPIKEELKKRRAEKDSYLNLLSENVKLKALVEKANKELNDSGRHKEKYIKANVKLQHLKSLVSKRQSLTQAKQFVEEINLIEE